MELRSTVFLLLVGFPALASAAVAESYVLTPKMIGNFKPTTGMALSSGTPSGRSSVAYQAFDHKRHNKVSMYCSSEEDFCQPIELIFAFTDAHVRCDEYRLYVASDIPEEQKPVNWTLQCEKGDKHPWVLLDAVTNFDWSNTDVYKAALQQYPLCSHYMLAIVNPRDTLGGMTATISELELRAFRAP